MATYLLRRAGMTFAVVILVTTILGALAQAIPGDPVTVIMGPRASPELADQVRDEMGLDEPLWRQVVEYLYNAAHGDLGRDFVSNEPVTHILGAYTPHTMILAFSALLLAAIVGVPLGVYSATRLGGVVDGVVSVLSIAFITVPAYVVALLLLLVFAIILRVSPALGAGDITKPLDYASHLILPASALAVGWAGYFARIVRSSMLEIGGRNYIRVARSLGIGERIVAYQYMLKNAIVPTVSLLGVALGDLLGGAVFVEVIFSRPGVGSLVVDAISDRNYPIVRGAVLEIAILFVVANLIADLSYRFLDPRVRVETS